MIVPVVRGSLASARAMIGRVVRGSRVSVRGVTSRVRIGRVRIGRVMIVLVRIVRALKSALVDAATLIVVPPILI